MLGALAGALSTLAPLPGRAAADDSPVASDDLLRSLAARPHLLLMRHAQTVPGVGDPPGFRLGACGTQRNLSEQGRAQARALGGRLRAAGITFADVRSSAWCRCIDTAVLAFGRHAEWPPLNSFFDDRSTAGTQVAAMREGALRWLDEASGRSGWAAWITHQVNITALTGLWSQMGEALVLARAGDGTLTVMARVRP